MDEERSKISHTLPYISSFCSVMLPCLKSQYQEELPADGCKILMCCCFHARASISDSWQLITELLAWPSCRGCFLQFCNSVLHGRPAVDPGHHYSFFVPFCVLLAYTFHERLRSMCCCCCRCCSICHRAFSQQTCVEALLVAQELPCAMIAVNAAS